MQFNTINREAQITGIPHSRIRAWIKSGEVPVPGFLSGTRYLVNHEEFVSVINDICRGGRGGTVSGNQ